MAETPETPAPHEYDARRQQLYAVILERVSDTGNDERKNDLGFVLEALDKDLDNKRRRGERLPRDSAESCVKNKLKWHAIRPLQRPRQPHLALGDKELNVADPSGLGRVADHVDQRVARALALALDELVGEEPCPLRLPAMYGERFNFRLWAVVDAARSLIWNGPLLRRRLGAAEGPRAAVRLDDMAGEALRLADPPKFDVPNRQPVREHLPAVANALELAALRAAEQVPALASGCAVQVMVARLLGCAVLPPYLVRLDGIEAPSERVSASVLRLAETVEAVVPRLAQATGLDEPSLRWLVQVARALTDVASRFSDDRLSPACAAFAVVVAGLGGPDLKGHSHD